MRNQKTGLLALVLLGKQVKKTKRENSNIEAWILKKYSISNGPFIRRSQSIQQYVYLLLCVCLCVWSVVSDSLQPPWEFSRQEYWSGLSFLTPGDLPDPGIKPESLVSPALQEDSLPLHHLGNPFAKQIPIKGEAPPGLPWRWKNEGLQQSVLGLRLIFRQMRKCVLSLKWCKSHSFVWCAHSSSIAGFKCWGGQGLNTGSGAFYWSISRHGSDFLRWVISAVKWT